jgi:5-methylcytosine-specific restriction endonuclease McrA
MSSSKKIIRKKFRDDCFARDRYSCAKCDFKSAIDKAEKELDAHHITDRNLLPNGGYVKENG